MRNQPITLPSSVAITIRLAAASEDTASCPKPGQRKWWLQGPKVGGDPWHDIGTHPANQATTFTYAMVPNGKYLLGCGLVTRIRFVAPSVPCAMAIDSNGNLVVSEGGKPTLTVVPNEATTPAPQFHVRNAPMESIARGVTYPSTDAAFAALAALVSSGQVSTGDVSSGRVVVAPGAWPVASYPPPVSPAVAAAMFARKVDALVSVVPDPVIGTPHTEPVGSVRVILDEVMSEMADRESMDDDRGPGSFIWNTAEEQISAPAPVDVGGFAAAPPSLVLGDARNRGPAARQPYAIDALLDVSMRVAGEDRRDLQVALSGVTMAPDGRVTVNGSDYGVERAGFGELITLRHQRSGTLPRARALLDILPAPVRAQVWNAQNVAPNADTDADMAVVRTRLHHGKRSAFAVVSRGYSALDADTIADITREALRQLPGGDRARGTVSYNPSTTGLTVDVLFEGRLQGKRATREDDGHVGGVRISSADNGTGSIRASTLVWRLVCSNGMMGYGPRTSERIVHRGNRDAMVARLAESIRSTSSEAAGVVDRFVALRETPVHTLLVDPSEDRIANIRAVMRAVAGMAADDDTVTLPTVVDGIEPMQVEGIGRDVLVEQLLSAWNREPGDTMADVVNAITRLHTERVPVPVLRVAEEYAGQLTYDWS